MKKNMHNCYQFIQLWPIKVLKGAKIRNQYNQAQHLTQDTTWESDKYSI